MRKLMIATALPLALGLGATFSGQPHPLLAAICYFLALAMAGYLLVTWFWMGGPASRVRVIDTPRKPFRDANGETVYVMTQVWIANRTHRDILDARCTIQWRRIGGSQYEALDVCGIWLPKRANGLASFIAPPKDAITLLSNGDECHLGLVAKIPSSGEAYSVCTGSYYAGPEYPNYQHPKFRLEPGQYDVTIVLEARGKKRDQVKLQVTHAGGASDVIVA